MFIKRNKQNKDIFCHDKRRKYKVDLEETTGEIDEEDPT
jgi:hypothetical protein